MKSMLMCNYIVGALGVLVGGLIMQAASTFPMAFTENGKKLYDALNDERISQIAWEKYGFRTGITGGNYDVSSLGMAVPSKISNTVTSLKMDYYNRLIEYLSTK